MATTSVSNNLSQFLIQVLGMHHCSSFGTSYWGGSCKDHYYLPTNNGFGVLFDVTRPRPLQARTKLEINFAPSHLNSLLGWRFSLSNAEIIGKAARKVKPINPCSPAHVAFSLFPPHAPLLTRAPFRCP